MKAYLACFLFFALSGCVAHRQALDCLYSGDQASLRHTPDSACAVSTEGKCFSLDVPAGSQVDLGSYAYEVQKVVQSNWHPPEAGMVRRYRGWVELCFSIHRDGTITNIGISHYSGCSRYDAAAINALRASSGVLPFPPEFAASLLRGHFRFFYNMPDGECGGA